MSSVKLLKFLEGGLWAERRRACLLQSPYGQLQTSWVAFAQSLSPYWARAFSRLYEAELLGRARSGRPGPAVHPGLVCTHIAWASQPNACSDPAAPGPGQDSAFLTSASVVPQPTTGTLCRQPGPGQGFLGPFPCAGITPRVPGARGLG